MFCDVHMNHMNMNIKLLKHVEWPAMTPYDKEQLKVAINYDW